MRRTEKTAASGGPPWLITYCDLTTLLLTFFVMLVSMSVVDERNKMVALGSVSASFGADSARTNPKISFENKTTKANSGPMRADNLDPIKNMLREDSRNDLNFQENRFVQIVSINADVLFKPGETTLSDKGLEVLNRMLPYLMRMRYPLLVAGHTANRRDEEGAEYRVDLDETKVDSTWPLSLARAQSVYRHFLENGIPADRLSLEAFGRYHPRFPDRTPDGRLQNRRVDLVLDKRSAPDILDTERAKEAPLAPRNYLFRDFRFTLEGGSTAPGGR